MSQIVYDTFVLNEDKLTLSCGEKTKEITAKEVAIIKYIFKKTDIPIFIEYLLMEVWGEDNFWIRRTFDVYFTRLKKMLPDIKFEKDDYYLKVTTK